MTENEHIQKALDTLTELCDAQPPMNGVEEQRQHDRRAAAEEILRHYREQALTDPNRGVVVTVKMEGHVPVRPVERAGS